MRPRAGVLAIGVLVVVCATAVGAATDAAGSSPTRLRVFDGCGSFETYMRKHALPLVGRVSIGIDVGAQPGAARGNVSGAPKSPAPSFSGTNVQEEGVDEPDTVKTDGRYLFVASGGRVSAIDVRSRSPRLVDTLRLGGSGEHELLLRGDRLLVHSRGAAVPPPRSGGIVPPRPIPIRSVVSEVDVGEPANMRLVRTMELDGGYLTARLSGHTARIVLSSAMITEFPLLPTGGSGTGADPRLVERNKAIIRGADAASWLPSYTVRNAAGRVTGEGRLVGCRAVLRPPVFSGVGMVTVVTVDLERGLEPVDSDAIAAAARVVYASPTHLYVATYQPFGPLSRRDSFERGTMIHQFDISSPTETRYTASGRVPGVLLDQWSMSERNGVLRVASTSLPVQMGGPQRESETIVTTLAERGGKLVQLGRVGGLGRGERVFAVRFVGDVGYVVTFEQVDPLYTIDLSNPARPVVRGELKIRGYSAYLHPVGDDLLLGIGQDATAEGRTVGTKATLFDVSNLRQPKLLDSFALGAARSQAEEDHHAFLWWPPARLAVIPIQIYVDRPFVGALGLHVGRAAITEVGRIVHPGRPGLEPVGSPGAPINRSLVVGDTLYTVSVAGVKASALGTFAALGFVRLPFDNARGTPPPPKIPPPPRP